MARFRARAGTDRHSATPATTAPTTAIGHNSGTNAAPTVTARPVAHAARRASFGGWLSIRPASIPMSGISTNATALPIRPAEIAPNATGSSA